jgi:hypothetical protein
VRSLLGYLMAQGRSVAAPCQEQRRWRRLRYAGFGQNKHRKGLFLR